MALLEVEDLHVDFPTPDGVVHAVRGLTFEVDAGKTLAIVGESGSGKSVSTQTITGLTRGARVRGMARFDGVNLLDASPRQLRELRGEKIGMIFQDPLSSLHPYYRVGWQLVEMIRAHRDVSKREARQRAIELLDLVQIPRAADRIDDFPHQFSGGMRQRVMIAMAMALDPSLLIADEPTTALDVTVQAQVLSVMQDLQAEFGTAIILITHDLGVVAEMADDVAVMYGGRVVERGTIDDVFYRPEMPYTWGLLGSVPRLDEGRSERLDPIPGQPPSLINLPSGCVFRPRCQYSHLVPGDRCATERPDLLPVTANHSVRCHIDPAERRRVAADRLALAVEEGQQ